MRRAHPALTEGRTLDVLRQLDQDGACTRADLGGPSIALRQAIHRLKAKGFAREALLITAEGRAALDEIEADALALANTRARAREWARANKKRKE